MVELDGLIYVLGGENEAMELTTVEVFDPHFNTWKPQTSMTMVRSVRPQEQNPPRALVSVTGAGWAAALYVGVLLDPPPGSG